MSVYCGANQPTNGQKEGTALDCLNKGQIRLYGRKLAPPKIIDMIDGFIPRQASLASILLDAKYSKARYQKLEIDREDLKKKLASPISETRRTRYQERIDIIRTEMKEIKKEQANKKIAYMHLKEEEEAEERKMKLEAKKAKRRRKQQEEEAERDRKSARKVKKTVKKTAKIIRRRADA